MPNHDVRPPVAVLSLQLSAGGAVQITPDGVFRARDGRPRGLPGWRMDADIAERVLARLKGRTTKMVVDYEHQTLLAEHNGQPAPAAGWIDPAEVAYRPGSGLWAPIQWTARAKAHIDAGEYAYLSPVMPFDPASGEVLDIAHVALVNFPGLDGMAPVAALSALTSRYQLDPPEAHAMELSPLVTLLGLPADAAEQDVLAAVTALKTRADQADGLHTEIAALKAQTEPDNTLWVPRAVYDEARQALVALKATATDAELDRLIDAGLSAGKITGQATAKWLRAQGLAVLKAFLDDAPAVQALTGQTQTHGQPPAGAPKPGEPEFTAALKAEFGDEASWRAYQRANAAGRIKHLNTQTSEA